MENKILKKFFEVKEGFSKKENLPIFPKVYRESISKYVISSNKENDYINNKLFRLICDSYSSYELLLKGLISSLELDYGIENSVKINQKYLDVILKWIKFESNAISVNNWYINNVGNSGVEEEFFSYEYVCKLIHINVVNGIYKKELEYLSDKNNPFKNFDFFNFSFKKEILDSNFTGISFLNNNYFVKFKDNKTNKIYLVENFTLVYFTTVYMPYIKNDMSVKEFEKIDSLMERISLATPIIQNVRRNKKSNYSSCFILKVGDDRDHICESSTKVAKLSSQGGGVGINLNNIRSKKMILGNDASSRCAGASKMTKKFMVDLEIFDQGGKRSGSGTVALPFFYPEIIQFLDNFLAEKENIDDVYNRNIFAQICVWNIFMKRTKLMYEHRDNSDGTDVLITLIDGQEYKKYNNGKDLSNLRGEEFETAYLKLEQEVIENPNKYDSASRVPIKDIWEKILELLLARGIPYFSFMDEINNNNPNRDVGNIYSVNLCTESFSNFNEDLTHVCNLNCINLSKFDLCDILNTDILYNYVRQSLYYLNDVMAINENITQCTKDHNNLYSVIGIGVSGLFDLLLKCNVNFSVLREEFIAEVDCYKKISSLPKDLEEKEFIEIRDKYKKELADIKKSKEEDIAKLYKLIEEIAEKFAYCVIKASNEYLKDKVKLNNNFQLTPQKQLCYYSRGLFFGHKTENSFINSCSKGMKEKWKKLIDDCKKHGTYNTSMLAIAPYTQTSLLMGTSPSIYPPITSSNYVSNGSMYSLYYQNNHVFYGKGTENYKKNMFDRFQINLDRIVDITSIFQKYTDQGISMDFIYNTQLMEEYEYNEAEKCFWIIRQYVKMWEKKLKSVYYLRMNKQKIEKHDSDIVCAGCVE